MFNRLFVLALSVSFVLLAALPASAQNIPEYNTAIENPVIITEVYPSSTVDQSEFIEIHNPTEDPQDLENFFLDVTTLSNGTKYTIDLQAYIAQHGTPLEPEGYLALIDAETGDEIFFSLSNDGANITLRYEATDVTLELFSLDYFESDSAYSWSWFDDEWLAGLPTPGEVNQLLETDDEGDDNDDNDLPTEVTCQATDDVIINEILADPDGRDTEGGEFVELRNTGSQTVSLEGCIIMTDKLSEMVLDDVSLAPGGFYAVELFDDLLNGGGSVEFITETDEDVVEYSALAVDEAWALIDGQWQETTVPTPGEANKPTPVDPPKEEEGLGPCPPGKFRNPETNRCKNIVDSANTLTPCGPGRIRNPLTNRCRNVNTSSSSLVPCEEGQERNPETNRCRKVSEAILGTADFPEPGPTELHNGVLIMGTILALAYGIYEYRLDLENWYARLKEKRT